MGHGVVNYVAFARLLQLNVDRSEGLPHPCCGRTDNVSSCPCGQHHLQVVPGATDDAAELQLEWIPCSLNLF